MATNTLGSLIINVESNTTKLVDGFNRAEQTVNKSISAMKTSIGTLVSAYASLSSATNLLQTAGQFEQYATSLKVLSGSASQAEKAFAWVKDFTAKTPYTLNETMEAFIRLKAYGIDATSGSLKTLGDTASAMGKPLMAAVEAMADAMVGENERLKEFGIRASKQGETIAYKWMDASGQAKTKIIQNNSEIIQSTLEAIFNEKYAGMMDEQSKTWVGAVSNLEDTWTSFKDEFARSTGMFDTAKTSIKELTGFVSWLNENLDDLMPLIKGVAVTTAVMVTATKGAALAESAYASVKAITTAHAASHAAILEAETKAQTMGTYAQTLRTAADKVAAQAKASNLILAQQHATMLAKEAAAAEAAALAQTKHSYALRATGVSAGLMGTALKAIPFLAVASTVAILATSFFDAKTQSDDLADSLNTTADKLAKLSQAQLAFKRQNISLELQDATRKLTTLKLSAGATKGRSVEDQAEIDDLQDYVNQLKESAKEIAKAQTDIREAKTGKKEDTKIEAEKARKIEIAALNEKYKPKKEKKTESEKEDERLAKDISKAKLDAAEYNAEQEAALALSVYQAELDAAQFNIDQITQMHIDAYNAQEQAAIDSYERQAQAAIRIFETSKSEVDKINADNLSVWESAGEFFDDTQMNEFFKKWQESIDGVKGGYDEIQGVVSSFVEESLNSKDWTAGLTGQYKALANVNNAYKDIQKQTAKYDKAVKNVNESNLTDEEKKIELKKLEEAQLGAQIGAYANLAGAAAGFFEEGSKGAKAMQAVSATLGITQGIQAIISAWGSAPFPFNMPAVAATTASVLPMIGQLTSLGGSGGSGGGGASASQVASDTAKYESEQANFIVDRLDRQIELLESIDKGGTSAKTKTSLAGSTFEADIASLWADLIGTPNRARAVTIDRASNITGNKLTDVQYVIGWLSDQQNAFSAKDWRWLDLSRGDIIQFQSDLEQAVSDFALSLADVRDIVNDSSEGFKEIYDALSGTDYYKMRDLTKAYEELGNSIVGNTQDSMLSYISKAVTEMEKFGEYYIAKTKVILNNGTIDEQVASLKELSDAFGITFNNSTEEALNFLNSIELVSEAMIRSRENASQFLNSLLSQQQQAESLANVVGVQLAGDVGGLADLFIKLRDDIDGLTDADIDAINANLELLKNTDSLTSTQEEYNKTLSDTQSSISTLQGALNSIQSTIDKLRGAAGGADYSMEMFRQSMSKALSLKGSNNYEYFAKAVQDASGYSSVLFDSANFQFSRDQKFAQAVAANQFSSLEDSTLKQIDYLKMIEENTRAMVLQLSGSIDNLSSTINSQLATEIISRGTPEILKDQWVDQGSGVQTWLSSGGALAVNNTITDTVGESYQISHAQQFVKDLNALGDLHRIYAEAVARGISSTSLDAMMGWDSGTSLNWAIANNLPSFDIGTQNVPHDMIAKIHKGEAIVPKPQAEAWRNGRAHFGDQSGIISEMRAMREDISRLMKVNNEYQEKIDRNTKTSKFVGA